VDVKLSITFLQIASYLIKIYVREQVVDHGTKLIGSLSSKKTTC